MLGWQLINRKAIAVSLGLLMLMVATNVEAGVFGWLKRTEIQWSPEIRGVLFNHGEPVTNREVKRRLYYEGKERYDSVTTDANGHFYFPRKTLKVRRVLFDVSVALELYVVDSPNAGDEDIIFDVSFLNDLNYQSLDLVASDIRCELTAEAKVDELKNLEIPGDSAPNIRSKCTFAHANIALYSDEEIEQQRLELERIIDNQEGF
ncbi:hypothetical protein Q3O60_10820 [Alkalimonas collagenimarina]|uniref:DUF6795 domain-containing protein n=1 Tax=Alkalimonas collagenimarina TaxID=400390 RepID=A0ABT9H080_9GAMM|nr:DUF6795 domain-containing protein [Alkalimonas collagenimarina]MDP4536683.1 hypothetical protein [Alkalimonas collagenimarina]